MLVVVLFCGDDNSGEGHGDTYGGIDGGAYIHGECGHGDDNNGSID